jgi:RimJ/RimL family protein N-acetyltransferase
MAIPIASADGTAAGFLTPVTSQLAEDPAIIDALFRWRRSHMRSFLTVFNPTLEKTRNYLTAFSLPDHARILFLVVDRENRHVGHIGLCNIAPNGGEIDNVIRGEPVDVPGFMVCAHKALLRWAFSSLDLPLAYLNVLADNARAMQTYERVGFRATARTSLACEEHDGGYRLRPVAGSSGNGTGPVLVRMEILRDSFYREQSR